MNNFIHEGKAIFKKNGIYFDKTLSSIHKIKMHGTEIF